jgi:hypothetical protein
MAAAFLAATVLVGGILGQLAGRHSRTLIAARPPRILVIDSPYALPSSNTDWYRGNLHAASVQGIGKDMPKAVGDFYRSRGYAFLGISDQNTYTWVDSYRERGFAGMPMIDASYSFGELLALRADHWLPAENMQQAIDWVRRDGGLPILTSPPDRPVSPEAGRALRGLFGIEVYNARSAAAGSAQSDLTELWDAQLSSGEHVFAFAGDDLRSLADPAAGKAWIEVLAEYRDADSIFASIRQGAFFASSGAQFKRLDLSGRTITVEARAAGSLRFIGKGGRLLSVTPTGSASYTVTGSEGYVRVEALGDDGSRAWSQPFFISWRN